MKRMVVATLFFLTAMSYSQESVLRILKVTWLVNKRFEFSPGDNFVYKLKGHRHYRKAVIMALHDSTVELDNNAVIFISQLKCIKSKNTNYVKSGLRKFFLRGAILFLLLDTGNNLIFGRPEVVNPKAVYISGGLLAAGLLMKRTEFKKIRINRNKVVNIIDRSYQNLKAPNN